MHRFLNQFIEAGGGYGLVVLRLSKREEHYSGLMNWCYAEYVTEKLYSLTSIVE